MIMNRLSYIISIIIFIVSSAFGGTITGRVIYNNNGDYLIGASVYTEESMQGDMTDSNGIYSISSLQPGTYNLIACMVGCYSDTQTVHLTDESTELVVDFVLRAKPIGADPLVTGCTHTRDSGPAWISGFVWTTQAMPLEDATIVVSGTDDTTQTDLNGQYSLELQRAGIHCLYIEYPGYYSDSSGSLQFFENETTFVDFYLSPISSSK